MSKFTSNKSTLRLRAFVRNVVFVLSAVAVAPQPGTDAASFGQRRQLPFAAQRESQTSTTRINENGEGHTDLRVRYDDGARSLEVRAKGGLEFTDDDSDVKNIARDGYLSIEERRGSTWRRLEVVPGADAQPQRTFYVGGRPSAFDREGRAWLAEILPDVIRNTAIGARARVQRIYRQKGADGVLDEISLIKSDGAKRIYFRELLRTGRPDSANLRRAARQAAREISSDGEKASLLIESADLYLGNRSTAPDFFDAVGSISSDGERRRVLSAVLRRRPGTEDIVLSLKSAREISSDGEKASLLVEHLALFLDHPASLPTLFEVINSISSDGEHARVLSTLLKRHDLDRENLTRVLRSAERISSDGEKANVLLAAVRAYAGDARTLSAVADAAKTISSDGEKQRVLSAIARHGQRP
ncbi:MAG TPA: hypothetical protein VGV38_06485 [Pyrinomonadaceae bacterium]|nr:hypothetical protein [Pyrinomonadaceae bacterium]